MCSSDGSCFLAGELWGWAMMESAPKSKLDISFESNGLMQNLDDNNMPELSKLDGSASEFLGLDGSMSELPMLDDGSPTPAQITLLYESKDKKLCLFEDAQGHLTTVRSSRLA